MPKSVLQLHLAVIYNLGHEDVVNDESLQEGFQALHKGIQI